MDIEAKRTWARQLAAQVAKDEARVSVAARKDSTRRKILVGAAVLQAVEHGQVDRAELMELLDKALTKPRDRVLFGLPDPPTGDERPPS